MVQGALSLALLLGGVNAACAPSPAGPAPLAPAPSAGAPTQVWSAKAGRRYTGRIVVAGETIYAGSVDRKVYAVNLASGEVRWTSRLGGLITGGVLVAGDTVYVASGRPEGKVYALDGRSGRRLWRTGTGAVGAPLALVHGTLVALTQRGEVLGLDPAGGRIRWRRPTGFARIAAVPADSGTLVVATVDSLYRLRATDGHVLRRVRTPGPIVSPWLPYGELLLAGTTDSTLVAVGPDDLRTRWRVRLDAPVLGTPAAHGDTLFAASRRGTVYRVVPDSTPVASALAELDWPVTSSVTLVDGLILVGGADGWLRALRADGSEAWRLPARLPMELGPVALEDGLLAIGGDGDLHRYRR
jgi:outer membrane protein assembly factor BamB